MSLSKIPLKTKDLNENAIVEMSSSSIKPRETPGKNDRLLTYLKQSHNTLRKGFYSTRARPPLQKKNSNKKVIDIPVQKKPTFIVYRDEPKSSFALPKQLDHGSFENDLFSTIDTPVYTLSNDCLLNIFQLCGDFEDYCTLLSVCRRWRSLASQPFLWRNTCVKWINFTKKIDLLHQPNYRFEQLQYIQKLTITDSNKAAIRNPVLEFVKMSPLERLNELNLIHMNITDIAYLTSWLKNIKVLRCQNTQISKKRNLNMAIFFKLEFLQTLDIHFEYPCALEYHHFTLRANSFTTPRLLPDTIQSFSLNNIYDPEQCLDSRLHRFYNDIAANAFNLQEVDSIADDWLDLEYNLVMKYRMLASLSNLRSLTLGRVSSFTARVWRECLVPCGSKLEHLSMKHWQGLGKRESPLSIANRRLEQNAGKMDDSEAAISQFISSLKSIKTIHLDAFQCGPGLVEGVIQLNKKYSCLEKAENVKIAYYQDKLIDNCLISFI